MKVHVKISLEGISVNEPFEGATADEVVGKMKARVAKELNFAMKLAVNAMSSQMFAQEVVKEYNKFKKLSLPIPSNCQAFLDLAVEQGFATL